MLSICDVIEFEIASPAGSSAALLMRLPVESCCIALLSIADAELEAFAA
jgi:hypothetical protein